MAVHVCRVIECLHSSMMFALWLYLKFAEKGSVADVKIYLIKKFGHVACECLQRDLLEGFTKPTKVNQTKFILMTPEQHQILLYK